MTTSTCTAFQGLTRVASGLAADVALAAKAAAERAPEPVLIFDDATGRQIDFNLQGTEDDIRARLAPPPVEEDTSRSPGRPKLGVVAREVTLLPRHWDWLAAQPGGASATLRKLVETARAAHADTDRIRLAREAADRFMMALAGNQPGYEDAARALYAGLREGFEAKTENWPRDIRDHARKLAMAGFAITETP